MLLSVLSTGDHICLSTLFNVHTVYSSNIMKVFYLLIAYLE